MKKLFEKIKFIFRKPTLILVAGAAQKTAREAIAGVAGKEVLVFEAASKTPNEWKFFIERSQLPILVVSHIGEYHPEKEFFAGELKDAKEISVLAKMLPAHGHLILNYDDETVRDMHGQSKAHPLFFGLGARADIQASDIVLTQFPETGTNFKINYEGKTVPVWLEKLFGKEHVYAALAAAAAGEILGLNLVEISGSLKRYVGVAGHMKLTGGIKQSFILDDSENASVLSMAEGLDLLKRIKVSGKKIAVLGDIVGVGKYTIEAHEAIGENVALSADLLFTVGDRAKFFAEGARKRGMTNDRIFEFSEVGPSGLALQEKIAQGDLILIDGSKEMSMMDVVTEVKA
ncbi:MAG: hypothetical protein HYT21_01190 [Candidatus Nealsonbacteria bacterium]|nr:hypothetical protein [Candidatus Nealsonbacteria bacterium]